jgi:hypothetical protein
MSDALDEFVRMFAGMPEEEKAAFDALLAPELSKPWSALPGPQTEAQMTQADLLLYGGAAGGGKTDLLIGLALTEHSRSVIFRRAYVDLRGVEERMLEIRGTRDGYNASDMVLKTEDGRLLEFGALEKPGAEMSWQGRPHDFIGFDEGAQLAEAKVKFVMGWLRSARPGQRTRVVIASNPPVGAEGGWLSDWFAPWLDPLFPEPAANGELRWSVIAPSGKILWVPGPGHYVLLGEDTAEATDEEIASGHALEALSRTFIPARLDDNPYLRGTGYRAKLQALPEPLRSQLLQGDFLAGKEDAANQVIPTAWIDAAQARWAKGKREGARMLALGVDVAQGGADETVLAPLYGTWFDELIKRKGVDTKDGAAVSALIVQTMRDRCNINIDYTGGWGGGTVTHLTAAGGIDPSRINSVVFSAGSNEKTKDGALTFANMRAALWWRFREALDPESREEVALPPDRRLAAQLAAPTWKLRGESILVESKEEIRKRLGSSTDDADAVILAWHQREPAALITATRRPRRDVA